MLATVHWIVTLSVLTSLKTICSGLTGLTGSKDHKNCIIIMIDLLTEYA